MVREFQGSQADPEFPSSQRVLGNLGLLCLLYDQGNLEVRSVLWGLGLLCVPGFLQYILLPDPDLREYQALHPHLALPLSRGLQSDRPDQVLRVLRGSQAGPCLRVLLGSRCLRVIQVWLPAPLRAGP